MQTRIAVPLALTASLALFAPQDPQGQEPGKPKPKPELPQLEEPSPPASGSPNDPSPGKKTLEQRLRGATGQDPTGGSSSREDLVQPLNPRNPFLGVWRINKAVRTKHNSAGTQIKGYVIFTPSYFSLHVFQQSPRSQSSAFQTAMRNWYLEGGDLVTRSLLGVRSGMQPSRLLLEAGGYTERRRFLFQGPRLLRLYQNGQNYLELIKVEDHR